MEKLPKQRARKRFGQHFLHDTQVLARILSAFNPTANQDIIEIGPGTGVLTSQLLQVVPKITAIEIDRNLVSILRDRFDSARLTLIEADVLSVDISQLAESENSLRLIGNLPYNISTPLIFHLLDHINSIVDMMFMVQKEVAQRLAAPPGNKSYGRLSVMTRIDLDCKTLFDVAPESFTPPPKVWSSIIHLRPKNKPLLISDRKQMSDLVALAFRQRRKTIKNALKPTVGPQILEAVGIEPSLRPERITPEQYANLSNRLTALSSS